MKKKTQAIPYDAIEGSAVRAVINQTYGMFPMIEFTIKVRNADDLHFEMDLTAAGKFIQSGLDAFDAAIPVIPRPKRNTSIG